MKILYLDDLRTPLEFGVYIARNYDQFVEMLQNHGSFDLISLDHDLALEQYLSQSDWTETIDYSKFTEKTGYDCAKWLIENDYPVKFWQSHSFNPVGKTNIENLMKDHWPSGFVKVDIPFRLLDK